MTASKGRGRALCAETRYIRPRPGAVDTVIGWRPYSDVKSSAHVGSKADKGCGNLPSSEKRAGRGWGGNAPAEEMQDAFTLFALR